MKSPGSCRTKEVFLVEALGSVNAQDVCVPHSKKKILSKGKPIHAKTIATLASHGIDRILVYDKPRVSLLVVGENFRAPGLEQVPGTTYDYGSLAIKALLEPLKIRPVLFRRFSDEPKKIARIISFASNQSDMVILLNKKLENSLLNAQHLLENPKIQWLMIGAGEGRVDWNKKPVFVLPYVMEMIFKNFQSIIRPAIHSFMRLERS